jgi:hypothetical protein
MTVVGTRRSPAHTHRPTFVGLGAQKCASTWLHHVLAAHPQVSVPETKEIDFFSYHFDRGYQWYEHCFGGATPASRAFGEVSPSYFHEPAVPARVVRYLPEARLLLTLREPVERALSNHRHEVRAGHVTGDLSFETGLANNPMYVEQGLYATHLRQWLRHFERNRIHVVLIEDIATDPLAVAQAVYRFLGVEESFVPPDLMRRYNRSYVARSRALTSVKDVAYGATRLPGLRWAWQTAADLGLRSLYRGVNHRPSQTAIPAPRPETLTHLAELFAPEVRDLEQLLGRSLEHWLGRRPPIEAAA